MCTSNALFLKMNRLHTLLIFLEKIWSLIKTLENLVCLIMFVRELLFLHYQLLEISWLMLWVVQTWSFFMTNKSYFMRATYDDNNYIEEALNQSDSTWVGVFCQHEPHMLGVLLFSQLSEVEFFSVGEKQKFLPIWATYVGVLFSQLSKGEFFSFGEK